MVGRHPDFDRLASIAREAGAAIMTHYDGTASVELKADQSPITVADRAAHRVIVDALTAWRPDVPVVSEEGTVPAYETRRSWDRFWLVDPLDGTKEFIKRNGEFTVNIGLVEGGVPVLGVVFAPVLNRLYLGGRGHGAWKQDGGAAPERLESSPRAAGEPVVIVESRSHPSAELETYLGTIDVARRVQIGSSLKFCLLAEGAADVYPRFGPTMEWDTAAGDAVFRASGRDGERASPLRYNQPDLRHAPFVIGD